MRLAVIASTVTTAVSAHLDIESSNAPPASRKPISKAPTSLPARLAPGVALWVTTLYFAEGLPYSIVHQLAPQLFTDLRAGSIVVGLLSFYGLAWNLKFLVGPIVDGVGSLRGWVLTLQLLLAAATLGLATFASAHAIVPIAVALGLVAILAAMHDVSIDGYYIWALEPRAQAAFTGVRVAAYRGAMWAVSGGLVVIAGMTSYATSLALAAVALGALASTHAWLLPDGMVRRERRTGALAALIGVFKEGAKEPGIVSTLLFIVLFRAGDALMFAMNAPFLASIGLDTITRGFIQGVVGTPFSIGGAVLGGLVIARIGLKRTLAPIAILQSAAIALYVLLASIRMAIPLVGVVVALEQLVSGIGTAALTVFILERSRGAEKATRFAIGTAIMSLSTTFAGGTSGIFVAAIGYRLFFVLAIAASVPGVLLAVRVPKGELGATH